MYQGEKETSSQATTGTFTKSQLMHDVPTEEMSRNTMISDAEMFESPKKTNVILLQ